MIRPFTCVCLLMAAGSGLYLYQAKHQAQMLDREIDRTMTEISRLRQRNGVLRAEYQLEQDPESLGELTQQYLPNLKPTAPTQFTTWAELAKHLPAVPPPPEAKPPEPAPEEVPVADAEPPRPAPAADAERADAMRPTASRPNSIAAVAPPPRPTPAPTRQVARSASSPVRPASAQSFLLDGQTGPAAGNAAGRPPPPVPLAPRPALARSQPTIEVARAAPNVALVRNAVGLAQPASVGASQPPVVASALGMARTLLTVTPANAGPLYPGRFPVPTRDPGGNTQ